MCIAQAYMMGWRQAMTQQWVLSTIADWVLNEFAPPKKKKPPSRVVGVKVDRPSQKEHSPKPQPLIVVDGVELECELLFEGDFDEQAFLRECEEDLEKLKPEPWENTGNPLIDFFGNLTPYSRELFMKNWKQSPTHDENGKRRNPFRDWSETWTTAVH